jgi:hypothetical protein
VLETKTLKRVCKLDINAEIVGIELELVAFEQAAVFVDVHRQGRDVALGRQFPVAIARGIGLEVDPFGPIRELTSLVGHERHP